MSSKEVIVSGSPGAAQLANDAKGGSNHDDLSCVSLVGPRSFQMHKLGYQLFSLSNNDIGISFERQRNLKEGC